LAEFVTGGAVVTRYGVIGKRQSVYPAKSSSLAQSVA
jgi:hypothetical protein